LHNGTEGQIIRNCLSNQVEANFEPEKCTINIKQEDKVSFLMLGSVPTTESVIDWLHTVAATHKAENPGHHYFFMYCGLVGSPLLSLVNEEVQKLKEQGKLSPNFSVVPFTNQDDPEIALLMARSDVSVTRSGGMTSMELLHLHNADIPKRANKQVLIHSEVVVGKKNAPRASDFMPQVRQEMQRLVDEKHLYSSQEWQKIRKKMIAFCKQHDWSQQRSEEFVDNILNSYIYADHEDIEPLLQNLDESCKDTALRPLVEAQMAKMQPKQAYSASSLEDLRKLAIQRVLIQKGIVLWEGGNAKYLMNQIGAKVTTPYLARAAAA
jgi:hypothetical protein